MASFLEEVLGYVQLDERDRVLLRELHPRLAPQFEAIARVFYERASAYPGAAMVFESDEQIARLQCTLVDWMSSGLLGPYDAAFYDKRSRIGRRHVEIGLAQHYMFTAMNVVRTEYIERITPMFPLDQACEVIRAVNKLLDVELAVMLRHYQIDSEERLVRREREIRDDRLIAMRTLSAGLAHEVRNPLNAARLQLELLERRVRRQGYDAKLIETTTHANHELQRLTDLLNDFLSFARPPELHLSEQDVVEVCRRVLDAERPLAQHRHVHLELEPHEPLVARVDAGKLHQIIQNLVRNAVEAAPSGGHVHVRIADGDHTVHVRVRDDGPGIAADVLARIYEPFFSTKEAGTGMGMAIVHSLVTQHGGRIDVETSSSGTAFEIVVPAGETG